MDSTNNTINILLTLSGLFFHIKRYAKKGKMFFILANNTRLGILAPSQSGPKRSF